MLALTNTGGLHLALKRSNLEGSIIRAFDWDQTACQVYTANLGPNLVDRVSISFLLAEGAFWLNNQADISSLNASQLAQYQADLWLMSPACQPYTVLNPKAKGEQDPRAKSFLHLVQNVLPEMAQEGTHPSHLLVENVAGFEVFLFQSICTVLHVFDHLVSEVINNAADPSLYPAAPRLHNTWAPAYTSTIRDTKLSLEILSHCQKNPFNV
jgi:site-specific DNA-cytosine methylase